VAGRLSRLHLGPDLIPHRGILAEIPLILEAGGADRGIRRLSVQIVPPSFGSTYSMFACSAFAWAVSPFHSWATHTSPEISWPFTGAEM